MANEHFVLAASSNIAASGENTTPQLTEPSGLTTDDHIPGRIQDDENPTDQIDLTVDQYSEIEFCIQATEHADGGATYEFRLVHADGTPLASYGTLPTLTVTEDAEAPGLIGFGHIAKLKKRRRQKRRRKRG